MNRTLLCYAYGRGGQWEAICVDFDLAISGSSFREVQDGLGEMVDSYVEDARKEDAETARRLLNRRAPLFVRVKLAYKLFAHLIKRNRDNGESCYAGYDIPCHA